MLEELAGAEGYLQLEALARLAQDAADHVLRPAATRLDAAHAELAPRITKDRLEEVTALVPPDWFGDGTPEAYVSLLLDRAPLVPEVIR